MNILPEIFDKQARFKPWLWEKYGDTFDDEKNRQKTKEKEEKGKAYKSPRSLILTCSWLAPLRYEHFFGALARLQGGAARGQRRE